MRWQDVFTGADLSLINNKEFADDSMSLKKKFWVSDVNERRKLLMPFVWNVINSKGQLYGNRIKNNFVNVTNNMWFSYPGYNEILTGVADDQNINTNAPIDNPNINILETIDKQKGFEGKVVAFTSWETFPWILNTKRNGILVNAGWTKAKSPNENEKLLDQLSDELPNYTGGTRIDALTFHYGFEYLKKYSPRVLYLSFDETDHFAHEGRYDKYLHSANYIDSFLEKLWTWVQSQPKYKDKTTLIITTDHGRGITKYDSWRHHGAKEPNADQIWMAFMGPDTPANGERTLNEQTYQNQIAATMAALMNVKFDNSMLGKALKSVTKK